MSPVPQSSLPVLTLPTGLSQRIALSQLFEGLMLDAFMNQQPRRLEQPEPPTSHPEAENLLALHRMLGQGYLGSPITLRSKRINQNPPELDSPPPTSSSPRSSQEEEQGTDYINYSTLGPFTPEWAANSTGKSSSDYSSCPITPGAEELLSEHESVIETPTRATRAVSPLSSAWETPKPSSRLDSRMVWVTPSDPTTPPVKLAVSPARIFLRRKGPRPNVHPLTSRMLQSVVTDRDFQCF
ncbi:hypothetical protein CROQUDRAFT_650366 [Cronartium quercuum f. sp. fusiforme G11]|uniref:Uncharacterized protein n=1 Tax=Cronartium quercuum f. sp. fusiforme G11 TaxID=708437 RepID=A0A9P6TI06_9BASI|nr:hypothetical protein CROQUDRAFT_650366 [Cronartium quercuum f. sp. fusiforme G11]